MGDYIQVFTTTGKKGDAQEISRAVVEKRLAACAQIIGPITSTYWWKGKIEEEEEWICILKTREALYEDLEKTIREMHPYDVPEIVAVPIVTGSRSYLEWLEREVCLK